MLCAHNNVTQETKYGANTVSWTVSCNDCDYADGEVAVIS